MITKSKEIRYDKQLLINTISLIDTDKNTLLLQWNNQ